MRGRVRRARTRHRAVEELLQWADRALEYDDTLKPVIEALKRLEDPRLASILLRWLGRVQTGGERLLLSALAVCGSDEHVAELRALRELAEDPTHYDRTLGAISAIAARAGSKVL